MKVLVKGASRQWDIDVRREGRHLFLSIDGETVSFHLDKGQQALRTVVKGGQRIEFGWQKKDNRYWITLNGQLHVFSVLDPRQVALEAQAVQSPAQQGPVDVSAPIPGIITRILVRKGEGVGAGQAVLILDAMKLENEIRSPRKGVIDSLEVREGVPVNKDQVLFRLQ